MKQKNNLGKKIKQALFDSGLTQQQLAKLIKTDQSLISSWQSGKRIPTIKSLEKIANATNKPLNFFVDAQNIAGRDINITNNDIAEALKKELALRDDLIKMLKEKIEMLEKKDKK